MGYIAYWTLEIARVRQRPMYALPHLASRYIPQPLNLDALGLFRSGRGSIKPPSAVTFWPLLATTIFSLPGSVGTEVAAPKAGEVVDRTNTPRHNRSCIAYQGEHWHMLDCRAY